MRDVHDRLGAWMAESGMGVHIDAAGNLRGTYAGTQSDTPRLFIGSHLDTVPNAGAFDGVLGVVMAVELVRMLNGRRLPFAIEVVGFSEEEGVRFGTPFIGSRALIGTFDDDLLARTDAQGVRLDETIRQYGLAPAQIADAQFTGPAIGFLELHIEQGPTLEQLDIPLGIVETIVGQTRLDVTFSGQTNHAGTTPMHARRDALAGAAEWTVEVERHATSVVGLVATVGRMDISPGATNVVPGRCCASLDVRHADDAVRRSAVAALTTRAAGVAHRRGLSSRVEIRLEQDAVTMDSTLVGALTTATGQAGVSAHRMASGAGHDAMIVASRMPAAMLFIRSPGGISHHPNEAVREDDVAAALKVGLAFIEVLDAESGR